MDHNQKLSILLIEDNGMFLTIAQRMLKDHKVCAVETAKEGIEQYKNINPDITFLDIALPDGNGHDILKSIREMNPDAYVIMMTASRLKEDVLRSMEAGAEGYIMKPFSEGMVRECIKEFYKYKENKLQNKG